MSEAKPLLVIQYPFALNQAQHKLLCESILPYLKSQGWACVVLDMMSEGKATAYMPNDGNMEALSIDDIVSRIKGVDETHNEAI